jgi:hypothetical protein
MPGAKRRFYKEKKRILCRRKVLQPACHADMTRQNLKNEPPPGDRLLQCLSAAALVLNTTAEAPADNRQELLL